MDKEKRRGEEVRKRTRIKRKGRRRSECGQGEEKRRGGEKKDEKDKEEEEEEEEEVRKKTRIKRKGRRGSECGQGEEKKRGDEKKDEKDKEEEEEEEKEVRMWTRRREGRGGEGRKKTTRRKTINLPKRGVSPVGRIAAAAAAVLSGSLLTLEARTDLETYSTLVNRGHCSAAVHNTRLIRNNITYSANTKYSDLEKT